MRTHLLIGGLVILALAAAPGCSGDDSPTGAGGGTGSVPSQIVGTWVYQVITVNGTSVGLDIFLDWESSTIICTLALNSNGTYRYSESNGSDQEVWWQTGTIAVTGSMVAFTATANSDGSPDLPWSATWSVNGDNLALAFQEQGADIVITLTKPNPSTLPSEVVSTWHYETTTVNGLSMDLDTFLDWAPTTVSATLVINANGSFRYSEWDAFDQEGWWQSGTVAVNGNSIIFTATANDDGLPEPPWSATWGVNGDIITFTYQVQGANVVITLGQAVPVVIDPELVANWQYQSVMVNGSAANLDEVLEWDPNTVRATFNISSNGFYRYSEWNASNQELWWESGSVAINGANVTITPAANSDGAPGSPLSGTWSVNGNVLSLAVTVLGDDIVFTLTK